MVPPAVFAARSPTAARLACERGPCHGVRAASGGAPALRCRRRHGVLWSAGAITGGQAAEYLAAMPVLSGDVPPWLSNLHMVMTLDVVLLSSLYTIAFVAALRRAPLFPRLLVAVWVIDLVMQLGIAKTVAVGGLPENVAVALQGLLEGNIKKVLISVRSGCPTFYFDAVNSITGARQLRGPFFGLATSERSVESVSERARGHGKNPSGGRIGQRNTQAARRPIERGLPLATSEGCKGRGRQAIRYKVYRYASLAVRKADQRQRTARREGNWLDRRLARSQPRHHSSGKSD